MIRHIVDSRPYLSLILTVGIGTLLIQHFPFPDDNAVLQLIAAEKPVIVSHQVRLPGNAVLDSVHRLLNAVFLALFFRSAPRSGSPRTATAIPAASRPGLALSRGRGTTSSQAPGTHRGASLADDSRSGTLYRH